MTKRRDIQIRTQIYGVTASKDELIRELERRKSLKKVSLIDDKFTAQSEFIRDEYNLKVGFCTRRAGKSYGAGIYMAETAINNPGTNILYVSLTRLGAKKIIWKDVLKAINNKHKLGIKFNEVELTATFPNGSVIYALGADADDRQREKLLGAKYKLVIVDEAQSFSTDLRELIYQILKPTVADLQGTICLLGTPGNITKSLFFDITNGIEKGWKVFRWTAFDNPHMKKQWEAEIKDLLKKNPAYEETAWFKQQYLGQWCVEEDKLVYKYSQSKNFYKSIINLQGRVIYTLSVDMGYNDDSAFLVSAYSFTDPQQRLYIIEVYKQKGMDITDVANKIRQLQSKYDIDYVIADPANKQAIQEMVKRHNINIISAEKVQKYEFIQLLNDDLVLGKIKIHQSCQRLIDELVSCVWDEKSTKKQEDPRCDNHLLDAMLYNWRHCYQYLAEAPPPKIQVGSTEYYEQENKRMFKEAEEHYQRQSDDEGIADPFWIDDPFDNF